MKMNTVKERKRPKNYQFRVCGMNTVKKTEWNSFSTTPKIDEKWDEYSFLKTDKDHSGK